MTVLTVAYNVISPIFIIIGLGALLAHYLKPEPRTLSTVIVYLFTPMLVLHSMATSELKAAELGSILGLALVVAVVMSLIGLGLSRLLGFDRRLESAFLMTVILMNAGNYGLPLNEFAFGMDGVDRAVIYFVASMLLANTYGVFLASRGNASIKDSFLAIFKLPILYGLALGLVLNLTGMTLPLPLERVTELLGSAAVPGMLVLLGFQLYHAQLRGRIKPMLLAASLRLVVAPVIAVIVAALFGITGLTRSVSIVESAMPTAVIAGALAVQFDADDDFVAATILISTLASIATLSVLLALLGVR